MTEETPDDITKLAQEYLNSLEGDEDGLEGLQEELEYWKQQVDEFEDGTPMHEMAVEERDERRERIGTVRDQGEQLNTLQDELLERASSEFAPRDEWMELQVVRALSHALTGRKLDRIIIGGRSLPDDATEMTKREMVNIAKMIHTLAGDAAGDTDEMTEFWSDLTDTHRSIISALSSHRDTLSSGEISDEIGDEGTDSPGANIRYLRNQSDLDPYHSTDDGYTLSLLGRYVWLEYGLPEQESTEDSESSQDDQTATEATTAEDSTSKESEPKKHEDGNKDVDLSSFEIKE
jgi:hypothetical protein